MRRRPTTVLALLAMAVPALAAVPVAASGSEAASSAPIRAVRVSGGVFSPNRDGRMDTLTIKYHLPRPGGSVRLTVRRFSGGNRNVRVVDLGTGDQGDHTWQWDGRNDNGRVVRDGSYTVFVDYDGAHDGDSDRIIVDTNGGEWLDPGVAWSFSTRDDDSVDVASFTVDLRYLAVAGRP